MISRGIRSFQKFVHMLKIPDHHRCRLLSTADGIFRSPFPDVEIPKVTIADYIWENIDKWEDRTAVVCGITGHGYTYERMFRVSTALAANLRKKLSFQDGDIAAVMLPNSPDFPVAVLATLMAGGAVSGVNPLYTAHEVSRQLRLSDAKAVFTSTAQLAVVKEAIELAQISIPIILIRHPEEAIPEGVILFSELSEDTSVDVSCLRAVRSSPQDLALLPCSSGTTGLPKGVELTHRNLVANCQQLNEPRLRHVRETTGDIQDSVLGVLPFFHSYGSTVIMLHKLSRGVKIVTLPRFHPETALGAIEKYSISTIYAAPPIVLALSAHPLSTPGRLEPVELVMCGAAPLPLVDIHRLFERAGRKIHFKQGYGLTETSPMVTLAPVDMGENYSTIGYPMPNTELKIVDSNGEPVPDGELGEILVRGPQVMRGYRDEPAASADCVRGGWLHSGDLGGRGALGEFYTTERLKELIKVKGYQVAPAELESVIREHPAVLDAAVVGVKHEKTGETPKAFVVPRDGIKTTPEDITEFVNKRVAPYKRLGAIALIDDIPRNPSGKILRKEIRAKYC